jgi:hypothetical protein
VPHSPGVNQEPKAGPNVYTETLTAVSLSVSFCETEHLSSLATVKVVYIVTLLFSE